MKSLQFFFVIFALIIAGTSLAKVIDPIPVVAGDVTYRSHSNYVEAVATDSGKVLWKTVLFEAGFVGKYDPNLEADVQRNIITDLRLDGHWLIVRNKKKEEFRVDAETGKALSK